MSGFLDKRFGGLVPYVPGEQPRERKYIKLNTNESPFPPSEKAIEAAAEAAKTLMLYPDPTYKALSEAFADDVGVRPGNVIPANGSDEILDLAFSAFCGEDTGAVFPEVTYGFYSVFARKNGIIYEEIPLKNDFSIDPDDYISVGKTVFIANPNAPTGLFLPLEDVERIVASNPKNVVVIDEAYIDFGGESAVTLIGKYENLLVTRTFSKSRSMAGARLGFGIASEKLIADLNTIRFSTNPYNVNSMTAAAGIGSLADCGYFKKNRDTIISNRALLTSKLRSLGFRTTDSKTNFVFAESDKIHGAELYKRLKEKGILVRHFDRQGIDDFVRITVGTEEQINVLADAIKDILEEMK
ncbi:MAG: histidinol-phosphate transaminase [Clostridia bacterium]|nr:histidinol-phosphate transaminase [Clostridia bacterium]